MGQKAPGDYRKPGEGQSQRSQHRSSMCSYDGCHSRHLINVVYSVIFRLLHPNCNLMTGKYAMRTYFKFAGYGRRIVKRKGFSSRPEVMLVRLAIAREEKELQGLGKDYTFRYSLMKCGTAEARSLSNTLH